MTEVCGAAYPGTEWERVLVFSDHPAAARHPSTEGNWVWCFIFLLCSINVSHTRVHNLLDCFVSLAMTREEGGVCTVNLITMLRVT